MNKEKEVIKVKNTIKNIGIKLKLVSYIGSSRFEKEKTIFSIREFHRLLRYIKSNGVVYGVGVEDDSIIIHLFLDRPFSIKGNDVGEQLKMGGDGYEF